MSAERLIEIADKDYDGTAVTASFVNWTESEGDDNGGFNHISIQTTRGRKVYMSMADARELAAWLIEHAIDTEPTKAICGQTRYLNGPNPCVVAAGVNHELHIDAHGDPFGLDYATS